MAAIAQCAREEARIEQMQHGVLDAADILVDGHPVFDRLPVEHALGVRRAEAQEVPGRFEERVERVRLALRGTAAFRAGDVLPGRVPVERVARRVEGRSEEHTSALQSLMRNSYAGFC